MDGSFADMMPTHSLRPPGLANVDMGFLVERANRVCTSENIVPSVGKMLQSLLG